MPTFPPSSLKFRTAGFPRYGFKAGISGVAFPVSWFAIALRAHCLRRFSLLWVRGIALMSASVQAVSRFTPGALAPVRVMLSRSIITYSAPSAPLAGTSRLRRIAPYTRCLRCAYVHMPRRPTTGSELSSMFFHNMSSSSTTGNSSAVHTQYFTEDTGLQLRMKVSAFP
jgi:hypothetical protein